MKYSFNFSNWKKKPVLRQFLVDDIDEEYKTVAIKKEKATILALQYLFEKALDLIPVEKSKDEKNSDPENLI